jgi:hypothetical protein
MPASLTPPNRTAEPQQSDESNPRRSGGAEVVEPLFARGARNRTRSSMDPLEVLQDLAISPIDIANMATGFVRGQMRGPLGTLNTAAENGGADGAIASNALDVLSVGRGDEASGVLHGAAAALQGGDFNEAYRRRVNQARRRLAYYNSNYPGFSLAGQVAGSIPTALVGGGAANLARAGRLGTIPRMAMNAGSGRGLPALATQSITSAATAAPIAGVYNFNSAEGDWENRMQGVPLAMGQAALFGGAFPAATQGAFSRNPIYRAIGGAAIGGAVGGISAEMTGGDVVDGAMMGAGAGAAGTTVLTPIARAGLRGMAGRPEISTRILREADNAMWEDGATPDLLRRRVKNAAPGTRFADAVDTPDQSGGPGGFRRRYDDAVRPGEHRRVASQSRFSTPEMARMGLAAARGDPIGIAEALSRPTRRSTASRIEAENEELANAFGGADERLWREVLRQLDELDQGRTRRGGENAIEEGIGAAFLPPEDRATYNDPYEYTGYYD